MLIQVAVLDGFDKICLLVFLFVWCGPERLVYISITEVSHKIYIIIQLNPGNSNLQEIKEYSLT